MEKITSSSHKLAEEKTRLEGEAQKYKDLLTSAETQATSAQDELDALKEQIRIWLRDLHKIHSLMETHFTHSSPAANLAIARPRKKRASANPITDEEDIGDLIAGLLARIKPLKICSVELLTAAMRSFNALWSEESTPTNIEELAQRLLESGDRLNEWRESAAELERSALSFVLSWYEGINLDVLQNMRAVSPFLTDPKLIKKRQERAYSFIQYADVHSFVKGPETDEEEEDNAEEEGDDEEEDVDEEIDMDTDMPDDPSGGSAPAVMFVALKQ